MTTSVEQARALMERSRAEHFAVGAFNVDNQETLLAIARAADAKHAPVLVELSHAEAEVIGLANMRSLVHNYRFIHVDYSQASKDATDEQIIAATRAVVDYAAHTTGALVESEPHHFAGSSNLHNERIDYDELRKTFSTPAGARAFVAATGVDTFTAAVGNLHGRYPVPKELDLGLLRRIREAIDVNISLPRRQRHACTLFRSGRADRRQQGERKLGPPLRLSHNAGTPAGRAPGPVCAGEADRPGDTRGSGRRRGSDRSLRLDRQSAAVRMPCKIRPETVTRVAIYETAFVAGRKLQTGWRQQDVDCSSETRADERSWRPR